MPVDSDDPALTGGGSTGYNELLQQEGNWPFRHEESRANWVAHFPADVALGQKRTCAQQSRMCVRANGGSAKALRLWWWVLA